METNNNPLKIQVYGSPLLKNKCKEVEEVSPQIKQLLDQMLKLMRKENGLGLAGNQAGLNLALVVIETPEKVYKLINPKIKKRKGSIAFDEGCLSFPDIGLSIKRAKEVWVEFLDEQGKAQTLKADDLLAVILQHEIDHINGVVFIDRISFLRRFGIRGKLAKIKKAYKKSLEKE